MRHANGNITKLATKGGVIGIGELWKDRLGTSGRESNLISQKMQLILINFYYYCISQLYHINYLLNNTSPKVNPLTLTGCHGLKCKEEKRVDAKWGCEWLLSGESISRVVNSVTPSSSSKLDLRANDNSRWAQNSTRITNKQAKRLR